MTTQDVETYYENGVWKNRRPGSEPFSSGGPRLRQVAIGAEVARWAQSRHIIRDTTGAVLETHIYGPTRYPARSPIKTIRHNRGLV